MGGKENRISHQPFKSRCPSFPELMMGNFISLFLKGLIFPLKIIVKITARVIDLLEGKELYGLDHAILSVEVPPAKGMWMNMGYWKVC